MQELFAKTKDKIVDLVRNGSYNDAKELAKQADKVFDDIIFKQYIGISHLGLQEYEEAKKVFEINIQKAGMAEDYNNLGITLRFLNDYESSYKNCMKSIEICKDNPSFFGNLATTCMLLGKKEEALGHITNALALCPTTNTFWFDKGAVHFALKDLKNAEECYRAGLRIKPINEKYCVELFYCMGLQKKFPEAWKFYEFRYNTMPQVNNIIKRSGLDLLLERKDFYEEKIAISFEQGYGDNLMYLRFLEDFQKKAPNSYLVVQDDNLADYVAQMNIIQKNEIEEGTKNIICLMSLPYHLNVEKIAEPKYLFKHNPSPSKKLRIGICWAGSALHPMDYQRSTYLKWYEDFLIDDSIEIYGFVKDKRPRIHKEKQEVIDFAEGFDYYQIHDMSNNLTSVMNSIQSLQKIDILITVDTFMAHIAGSIGVPTYLLVSNLPDWRWGIAGETTDWYPSFQICRQKGDSLQTTIKELYEKIRSEYTLLISKDKKTIKSA